MVHLQRIVAADHSSRMRRARTRPHGGRHRNRRILRPMRVRRRSFTHKRPSKPHRHNPSADKDQRSSQEDRKRWPLAKSGPGNQLRQKEEKNDVGPQQTPEIPRWSIDRTAIYSERDSAQHNKENCAYLSRATQPKANQGVPTRFQQGSRQQQQDRGTVAQVQVSPLSGSLPPL